MGELRAALTEAGFEDVKTYLQSGNVVVSSTAKPESVRRKCEKLIAERFGLEIAVVVRTRAELAAVVKRNPLGKVATNPKRYQVSFLSAKLSRQRRSRARGRSRRRQRSSSRAAARSTPGTRTAVARSKLWAKLAGKDLGVTATSRNWTTVEAAPRAGRGVAFSRGRRPANRVSGRFKRQQVRRRLGRGAQDDRRPPRRPAGPGRADADRALRDGLCQDRQSERGLDRDRELRRDRDCRRRLLRRRK